MVWCYVTGSDCRCFNQLRIFKCTLSFTDKRFWSFCRSRLLVQRFKQRVIECTNLFFVVAEKKRICNFVNKKFELKVETKCFSKERFVWSRLSFFSLWQPCKQLFRPNRWSGFEAGLGPNYRLFRQFQNPDRQPLRNRRQHLLPGRESVRSKKDYKWWSQLNLINFWILLISSRYCLLHWLKSRILKQFICIIHILVESHQKCFTLVTEKNSSF